MFGTRLGKLLPILGGVAFGVVMAMRDERSATIDPPRISKQKSSLVPNTGTRMKTGSRSGASSDLEMSRTIRTPFRRINALKKSILDMASRDPLGALAAARHEPMPTSLLAELRITILRNLVAAEGCQKVLSDGFSGIEVSDLVLARRLAAEALAKTDPLAAMEWLSKNCHMVDEVPFAVFAAGADSDPEKSIATVQAIADEKVRNEAFKVLAEALPRDSPKLKSVLTLALGEVLRSEGAGYAHSQLQSSLNLFAGKLAAVDPTGALEFGRSYLGDERAGLLSEILLGTSEGNHKAAIDLARQEGDDVVDAAFWKWVGVASNDAVTFALNLPDGSERDRLLYSGLRSEFFRGNLSQWSSKVSPTLLERIQKESVSPPSAN